MLKEISKRRSLMGLIYGLVMLIPFMSVLVRCIYVQLNPNAINSYGESTEQLTDYEITYKYESNEVNSLDDLIDGNIYSFNYYYLWINDAFYLADDSVNSCYFSLELISFNGNTINTSFYENCNSLINGFKYYFYSTNDNNDDFSYYFYETDINSIDNVINVYLIEDVYQNSTFFIIKYDSSLFENVDIDYHLFSYTDFNEIVSVAPIYSEVSTLDNVFENSLNHFVQESNFGKLNLTNWFTSVFLDENNATNMLYLNFINWYMNYALLVSCVYLLFLVLMWFVNLARRLLTSFDVDRRL